MAAKQVITNIELTNQQVNFKEVKKQLKKATTINFSGSHITGITTMLFWDFKNLEEVDLSNCIIDLEGHGNNSKGMFSSCNSLKKIKECTNCLYTYQVVKLKTINNIREKWKACRKIMKQLYIPTSLLCYIIAVIMVIPMKRVIEFKSALLITLLYNTQCLLIQSYENYRGFLTACEATESLRLGGLIGILVRVPISIISILTPIGIYEFALGCGIDFLIRGIYYKYKSLEVIKKSNKAIEGEKK